MNLADLPAAEMAMAILAVAYCTQEQDGFLAWARAKGYLDPGEEMGRIPGGLMRAMLAHVEKEPG